MTRNDFIHRGILALLSNSNNNLSLPTERIEWKIDQIKRHADILQEKGYVFAMEGAIDDLQEVKEQLALSEAFINRCGKALDICSSALHDLDLAVIDNTKKNSNISKNLRRIIKKAHEDVYAVLSGAQPETE